MLASIITGTTWLIWSILMLSILPKDVQLALSLWEGAIFFILPIVNHVGIFTAIRRQNNLVQDAVSGQNSVLFRREKKAVIDMFVIVVVLLLCVAPVFVVNAFKRFLRENFQIMFAWSTSLVFVNSSINPVIYLVRSREIRNAVRSILCF